MFEGIWSQSPLDFWGRISEFERTIGMCKLMNSNGDQKDNC